MQNPLILRADADATIGTGHVMRCLALAQAWQDDGGSAIFVLAIPAAGLERRLLSEGMQLVRLSAAPGSPEDAAKTACLAEQHGARWAVVDGYHFGAEYQRQIRDTGARLLFMDDNGHCSFYPADLVLNQNLYAREGLYTQRSLTTRLLLGGSYALLRREFRVRQGWQREIPRIAGRLLITLGGSDPGRVTMKAIDALQQLAEADLRVRVVAGPSSPCLRELRAELTGRGPRVELLTDVAEMSTLMTWADLAVCAAGSTVWEMAFLGLPMVTIVTAENQWRNGEALHQAGAAISLGWHEAVQPGQIARALSELCRSAAMRSDMARCGRLLIDGNGAPRVIREMEADDAPGKASPGE